MRMTLQRSNWNVKIHWQLIEAFGVEKGLTQCVALSVTAVNVVLEKVIRNPNGTTFTRMRQCMANADIVFILDCRWDWRSSKGIKEAAVNTGLVMKGSKTKCVKITSNITDLEQDLIMDGQVLEMVQNSRYLSAL